MQKSGQPKSGQWESVIGLEIHVQLATRSKIFSGASTQFGAPPNTQASAIDIALPGTLPVLNEAAVKMAVTFGVAIGAQISERCVFDRKNYFYPDLPKGYQISQFERPIVGTGRVDVHLDDGEVRTIAITRAHLEEDAGKSLHEDFAGMTGIDLNRAGMPLLEIVSEPDLRSAKEAAAYFRQMHTLVRYLGICDGNLNEGSMRCDANVSVRPIGAELGERTEIKNLNSFRFLERAIDFEIARQIELIESGGRVRRETRLYDSDRNETRLMRSKELSDDYRYFPEPDLLPVVIDRALHRDDSRRACPSCRSRNARAIEHELGLSDYDAGRLTDDPVVARFFEDVVRKSGDRETGGELGPRRLVGGAQSRRVVAGSQRHQRGPNRLLIVNVRTGAINGKIAKSLFDQLWNEGDPNRDVDDLIREQGLATGVRSRRTEAARSRRSSRSIPNRRRSFAPAKKRYSRSSSVRR